jgi:hypothetical protein
MFGYTHTVRQGSRLLASSVVSLVFSLIAGVAIAQPSADALERSRQELSVFSDLLSAGLDLDEPGGLFGMNVGSIQSRYLFGQGAYLEIRSPLANRRQRLSLAALGSTLRDLQSSQNPFARFSAAQAPQALSSDAADSELVASLSSRIQDVDYELIVSSALRQASEAADALRSLEGIDEATYADIRGELASLRQELQANLATMSEMLDSAGLSADALYASACKASEQLLSFADAESLAIILAGLGDEGVRLRPDRVHILPIGELRQCATGAIDSAEIDAVVYSY